MSVSRRELFAAALAVASSNPLSVVARPKLSGPPFTLGVASGEPLPDGIVLWTRLLPAATEQPVPLNVNVPVRWEIAEDEKFRRVTRKGEAMATPALAHSVHVEATGLRPSRHYWYRFEADGHRSPAGQFRTAPARDEVPDRFRFAFASCQQWTQGLWTAYKHMADEDLDLVIHLGDYIYEKGYRGEVRPEGRDETFTLTDYRNRHALYKSDPLLQATHARFAWMTTWDDHEVSNNYVTDIQEHGQPQEEFLQRRAWGYQAFYEHMPLRLSSMPKGPDMSLYRRSDFGSLLRLHMLDTRQYRTDQPCGDGRKPACPGLADPAQTVLGSTQEDWLAEGLQSSNAVWDVLGQQIFMTLLDYDPGPDEMFSMDSWNGYPLARKRLVDMLAERNRRNTVVLTGDVHASWVGQMHRDGRNTDSPCVAAEFVGTSISSGGDGVDMTPLAEGALSVNPQIRYYSGRRGYVRCEVTPKEWRTDYRLLDYVTRPGSGIATKASFMVEPGRLTVERS
jgi:alkaline phosphatase D